MQNPETSLPLFLDATEAGNGQPNETKSLAEMFPTTCVAVIHLVREDPLHFANWAETSGNMTVFIAKRAEIVEKYAGHIERTLPISQFADDTDLASRLCCIAGQLVKINKMKRNSLRTEGQQVVKELWGLLSLLTSPSSIDLPDASHYSSE